MLSDDSNITGCLCLRVSGCVFLSDVPYGGLRIYMAKENMFCFHYYMFNNNNIQDPCLASVSILNNVMKHIVFWF